MIGGQTVRYNKMDKDSEKPAMAVSLGLDKLQQEHVRAHMEHRMKNKHGLSNTRAMLTLFKGLVGTGILSLPAAFANCGLWVGVVMTAVTVILNVHCLEMLVEAAHVLYRRLGKTSMDYAEVTEETFANGPLSLRRSAKLWSGAVNACIFAAQIGFCTAYMVFVSQNVQAVMFHYGVNITTREVLLVVLIPFLILSSLRTLKIVSVFAIISNVTYLFGVVLVLQYMFRDLPPSYSVKAYVSLEGIPLAFGTIMFSFEAVNLILPLENQMFEPRSLLRWNGVMNVTCVVVGCLYVALGFFGYIRFGDAAKTAGTVTLNLPQDQILYQFTKLLFAFAIFLTYAVQFYIPIDVIRQHLAKKYNEKTASYCDWASRIGLCLLCFGLSEITSKVDDYISLVGAFTCTALTMFFPPIIDTLIAIMPEEGQKAVHFGGWKIARIVKNIVIFFLGIVGIVMGTYAAILQIVNDFK